LINLLKKLIWDIKMSQGTILGLKRLFVDY